MKCCKLLTDGESEALPFRRVISTGFYDGPIEGFTECSQCGQAYAFRKLDWDDLQNVRIIGFTPITLSLDAIAKRLSVDINAHPFFSLKGPLAQSDDDFVEGLLSQHPAQVAAFEKWPGTSLVWRDISKLDLKSVTDWFSFLAIPKMKAD